MIFRMIDLDLKGERIKEFKAHIDEWLYSREWSEGECYPFTGIEALIDEFKERFDSYSIVYRGYETFGETITIGGEWPELGTALEININPITAETLHPFRVLYRWR
jgi:hypothetical protein